MKKLKSNKQTVPKELLVAILVAGGNWRFGQTGSQVWENLLEDALYTANAIKDMVDDEEEA